MIDTLNKFVVSVQGDRILILNPPRPTMGLSHEDALNLAAWIVSLVFHVEGQPSFEEVLEAVQST